MSARPAQLPPVLLAAPPACALQSSFWMPGCRRRCRTTPAEWRCGAWACRPLDPWTTSPTGECAGVGVGGQGGVEGEAPIVGLTCPGPCQLFDDARHACSIACALCTAVALSRPKPSIPLHMWPTAFQVHDASHSEHCCQRSLAGWPTRWWEMLITRQPWR